MADLPSDARNFIDQAGWSNAGLSPVAGDASSRQYFRLSRDNDSAILMVDPPGPHHGTERFAKIAQYLRDCGLSAPLVLAADHQGGFLLLEDLGDAVFAKIIREGTEDETLLYRAATDALIALHAHPAPTGLELFSPRLMTEQASLIFDWYAPGNQSDEMMESLHAALTRFAPDCSVMIHRDFHAENLLWQPHQTGVQRVGLIDFQDAMIGHPAYDLASLVMDARRDVSHDLGQKLIRHYCAETGSDPAKFNAAFHVLGVQRNLRILGIFTRLARRDGKTRYLDFMPRVWGYIDTALAHPGLTDLSHHVRRAIPAPNAETINMLRPE